MSPDGAIVDYIYEWAWRTAVPGETSTETFKRAIERGLREGRKSASADTRPEGEDATKIAAEFTSGAVPNEDSGDARTPEGDR
jgi:hypothetical protein